MARLLWVDGYEMFHGSFLVTPCNGKEPYRVSGDWLHKPTWVNDGYDIWYVQPKGRLSESYDSSVLSDMRMEDD